MLGSSKTRSICEEEAKFMQERISTVERNIAEFCHVFSKYSRELARMRDRGDELAKIVAIYADTETVNKSLSIGLENFASVFYNLSSYGDKRAESIDTRVVKEFLHYESICKLVKDDIKQIYAARTKEINRKRQLDRVKERNPRNRQQIIHSETELVRASAELSKVVHNLEEKTSTFEKQKLHDIKAILHDFIRTEMGYHAKALEQLTKAYKYIANIDEESDLEEFRKSLRMPDFDGANSRHSLLRTRTTSSLGSLGNIFSGAHNKKTQGIPKAAKSEETLDSLKKGISESEDSSTEDSLDDSEVITHSDDKFSTIRKYK